MAIRLLFTDRNLSVVGDPVECWTTVDCTLRFNEVSTGHLEMPAHPWIREQVDASRRVVVIRDGRVVLAGPIEEPLLEQSDDGDNSGIGKLTIDFADDLSHIANRITYPNPAQTPEGQTVDQWTYNGNGELALRDLVNLNAGPGARAERRVPRLVLGPLVGVGSNVQVSTRLEPLCDVLRSTALGAGGLGFRTQQVGQQIEFQVYAPRDLSNRVRFSFGLRNLRYLAYARGKPKATTAIVGGQGDGADRRLISRTASDAEAAWGRVEALVARPGNDPVGELQKAGDEALAEGGETARLQTSAWDTEDQRYPDHYNLGDRVSVQVGPAEQVTDLVRLVHVQAWSTAGELVSAMVGSQDASEDPAWVRQLRAIDRRLGVVERGIVPAVF